MAKIAAASREAQLRALIAMPLDVRARAVARALWAGVTQTRRRGLGGEFRELREYHPGDPLKRIDWRKSARGDRLLVREHERTTHLRVIAIADRSPSLDFPEGDPLNKYAVAQTLLAAVCVHALRQGHAVAVWDAAGAGAAPHAGPVAEAEALRRLDRPVDAAWTWPRDWAPLRGRADLVLAVSDWLDPQAPARLRDLGLQAARGVEVRALALAHPDEEDFPFRGPHAFVPRVGGQDPELRIDAATVAAPYRAALGQHRAACRHAAAAAGVALLEHRLDADIERGARFLAEGSMP